MDIARLRGSDRVDRLERPYIVEEPALMVIAGMAAIQLVLLVPIALSRLVAQFKRRLSGRNV